MEIQNFNSKDSRNLVDFLNETNHTTGTNKEISLTLFLQGLNMPSVTPEQDYFIARVNREIVGVLQMVNESPISRAVAIQTIPRSSIEKEVLHQLTKVALSYSKRNSLSVLHIQSPSTDQVAISSLNASGFIKVKTYLELEWAEDVLQNLFLPENYKVRSFIPGKDDEVLTDLQNTAFREHWGFCPNSVEEIRNRVQMERSQPEGILLIENESSIAGYNWTLLSENSGDKVGWIGMTGIHPNFRRNRLGRAVVLAGMHSLIKRGAKSIELEVDSENIPARELYQSLGFQSKSSNQWFEKHINL